MTAPLRVLLLTHPDPKPHHAPIVRAFEEELAAEVVEVEDGLPAIDWARHREVDVVLFFVRFRFLAEVEPLAWGRFQGQRVLYDLDTNQHFARVTTARFRGAWTPELRRHGLETLISTGARAVELFRDEGLDAAWVPKGYDPTAFSDLGGERAGICSFGRQYRARAAMTGHLRRAGVEVDLLERCAYRELNPKLNRFLACAICNMEATTPFGPFGRLANKVRPGTAVRLGPAPELMIKNYEAAAAGCAVFTDECGELGRLGFEDGETVLIYRTFRELADRISETTPQELRRIGAAAARLVRERHTWSHRARRLRRLLEERQA